jgi:hypothetical protein
MGSLFLFVGNSCTRELFVDEPDLKLVPAKNVAHQQVIGAVVTVRDGGVGGFAGFADDEFVGLQQTEQLNGVVFTAPGRTGNARGFSDIGSHGDGHSAEGLNALG